MISFILCFIGMVLVSESICSKKTNEKFEEIDILLNEALIKLKFSLNLKVDSNTEENTSAFQELEDEEMPKTERRDISDSDESKDYNPDIPIPMPSFEIEKSKYTMFKDQGLDEEYCLISKKLTEFHKYISDQIEIKSNEKENTNDEKDHCNCLDENDSFPRILDESPVRLL